MEKEDRTFIAGLYVEVNQSTKDYMKIDVDGNWNWDRLASVALKLPMNKGFIIKDYMFDTLELLIPEEML